MEFTTPSNYQAQAEKCIEWAERATDAETKLHWRYMAQAYLALAGAQEKEALPPVWGDASLLAMINNISSTRH